MIDRTKGYYDEIQETLPDSIAIIPGPGAGLDSAGVPPDTLPARPSAGSANDPPERNRGW